jgi:hypothetical protein
MSGAIIRVHYMEGDFQRFIKGELLEETPDFLKVQLNNYIVTIAKRYVIKWEVAR